MKVCATCKVDKPEEMFSRNKGKKDGLHNKCKACHTTYLKGHYAANRAYYLAKARKNNRVQYELNRAFIGDYLSTHPCVDCGETDPVVLEFDHVRGDKVNSVSVLAYSLGASRTRLREEIAKCEVRCANCHRRRTFVQRSWNGYARQTPLEPV